jgi:SAM-dependent methyltransferase
MFFQILFVIALILLASAAYAGIQGAPWVPTWKRDMDRIATLLDVKAGESFVELGCGNARVCRHIKKQQPEAAVTGVELSFLQFAIGWLQNKFSRSDVQMKLGNVFHHDLSKYNTLYIFLMPETYKKIKPKLESELSKGTRVVTYVWPIKGWEPTKIDELEGAPQLYLYER